MRKKLLKIMKLIKKREKKGGRKMKNPKMKKKMIVLMNTIKKVRRK